MKRQDAGHRFDIELMAALFRMLTLRGQTDAVEIEIRRRLVDRFRYPFRTY